MSILSLEFALFFAITAIIYFIVPGKIQWIVLLLSGIYYLYCSCPSYQRAVFLVFIIVNYIVSILISGSSNKKRFVYILGLIFDVLYLCILKYFGFFTSIFVATARLASINISIESVQKIQNVLNEIAPIGMSYFVLIVIAYITDVYWEKINVQKNPFKFMYYATFFPLLTSGPIVQYEQMEGELFVTNKNDSDSENTSKNKNSADETSKEELVDTNSNNENKDNNVTINKKRFDYERVIRGLQRVLYGVFKKLVIAERLAVIVNTIYGNYDVYAGYYIPVAATFFAFQLYTDFSGLMDIVIGCCEIIGITLPENFDTPFYSRNLSEFWRRWHITLGGFLRDYVLYPVQRSKAFKNLRKTCKNKFGKGYEKKFNLPLYLSLFVSWFLIGLWHGGGWNYIIGVGLYMWFMIVLGEVSKPLLEKIVNVLKINTECFSFVLFERIRTFIVFAFGLSFFRAATLLDALKMWKSAFTINNIWIFFDKSLYKLGLSKDEFIICVIGLIIVFVVSFIKNNYGDVRDLIRKQNFAFRLIIFGILFSMIVMYGYYGTGFETANFIYGRF